MSDTLQLLLICSVSLSFCVWTIWDHRQFVNRTERDRAEPELEPPPDGASWRSIAFYDALAERAGLLDPDQPTRTAHHKHEIAQSAEFSPRERRVIRSQLGLWKTVK